MILDYILILIYIMLGFTIDVGIIFLFFVFSISLICLWTGVEVGIDNKQFKRIYYLGIVIVCVAALAIHYTVGLPGHHLCEFLINSYLN